MSEEIFAMVEYITSDSSFDVSDDYLISNFGDFNIGKSYDFFGLVGGSSSLTSPLSISKGLPKTLSTKIRTRVLLKYVDKEPCNKCITAGIHKVDFDGYTLITNKELKQVCNLSSIKYYDKHEGLILNPVFTCHTWLSLLELKTAYGKFIAIGVKENPVYFYPVATLDAIITSMEVLEEKGYLTRIVFWFS